MKRQLVLMALLIVALVILVPARPAAAQDPAAVITTLGNEALKVLGPKVDPNLRVARFRELFEADFNAPGIARFVLGRYWRLATPTQQQEFIRLFTDYISLVYANRLAEYSGERLRVTGTHSAPDGEMVASEILRTNGQPPARVDWLLNPVNSSYKISDVMFEGVSMAATQRSEFASFIQRNGGQVQSLITALQQKTASAGLH